MVQENARKCSFGIVIPRLAVDKTSVVDKEVHDNVGVGRVSRKEKTGEKLNDLSRGETHGMEDVFQKAWGVTPVEVIEEETGQEGVLRN